MDDTEKFKKYMKYFNKQLDKFQQDMGSKLLNKSLDDRLAVELAGRDKSMDRLKTCNEYSYVLSSLVFIYQKLNSDKDLSNVIRELGRIQTYMSEYEQLDKSSTAPSATTESRVNSSISQQNFNKSLPREQIVPQGTHIKFQNEKSITNDILANIVNNKKRKDASKSNTNKVTKP